VWRANSAGQEGFLRSIYMRPGSPAEFDRAYWATNSSLFKGFAERGGVVYLCRRFTKLKTKATRTNLGLWS
jgi:hypothetical protein